MAKTKKQMAQKQIPWAGPKSPFMYSTSDFCAGKRIELTYLEIWEQFKPRKLLVGHYVADSRSKSNARFGECKSLTVSKKRRSNGLKARIAAKGDKYPNPKHWQATFIDVTTNKLSKIFPEQLVGVPDMNEYLRELANDHWYRVVQRYPGKAVLEQIIHKTPQQKAQDLESTVGNDEYIYSMHAMMMLSTYML